MTLVGDIHSPVVDGVRTEVGRRVEVERDDAGSAFCEQQREGVTLPAGRTRHDDGAARELR